MGIWVNCRIQLYSYVLHEKGGTQSSKAIQILVAFLYNNGVHSDPTEPTEIK